jgi:hypothetical protein
MLSISRFIALFLTIFESVKKLATLQIIILYHIAYNVTLTLSRLYSILVFIFTLHCYYSSELRVYRIVLLQSCVIVLIINDQKTLIAIEK